MKGKTKTLIVTLCILCTMLASVFATAAYLTSQDKVTNTFTVGKVKITLDEARVTPDGEPDGNVRVQKNAYHLIPGCSYTKDPTVHVDDSSEECWLFVKVENGIAGAEKAGCTIADQMKEKGWTLVAGQTNIYAYKEKAKPGKDYIIFKSFEIDKNADIANLQSTSIVVTGYAIQAEGFDTAAAAIAAAPFPTA